MAEIKIIVKTNKVQLIEDAMASVYNYQDTIPDGLGTLPNPISKKQFVKKKLKEFLQDVVQEHKRNEALGVIINEEI